MGVYALLTNPSRYSSSNILLLISSPFLLFVPSRAEDKENRPSSLSLRWQCVVLISYPATLLPMFTTHLREIVVVWRWQQQRQGKVFSAVSHYPRPAPALPFFSSFFTKLQRGGSSSLKRFTQLKFVKRRGRKRKKERRVRREKTKLRGEGGAEV